jgi:hypothetical protein
LFQIQVVTSVDLAILSKEMKTPLYAGEMRVVAE